MRKRDCEKIVETLGGGRGRLYVCIVPYVNYVIYTYMPNINNDDINDTIIYQHTCGTHFAAVTLVIVADVGIIGPSGWGRFPLDGGGSPAGASVIPLVLQITCVFVVEANIVDVLSGHRVVYVNCTWMCAQV